MRYTQFLIFEIGTECNLGDFHTKCPNQHGDRYRYVDTTRPMTDDLIVSMAVRMYREFGFRGLVGFHYYNEPLCQMARMFRLMDAIRQRVPEARFILWSNGTLLPSHQARFRQFEHIYLTDYSNLPGARVRKLRQFGNVTVCRWELDDRLTAVRESVRSTPCHRMFTEFICDYFGNVHLCCYDWRGLGFRGNVYNESLDSLVHRWQIIRNRLSGKSMSSVSPDSCLYCTHGGQAISSFDPTIAAAARCYATAELPRVAVVFVHYRLPGARLRDHFAWNAEFYPGGQVYVVAEDSLPDLPAYATTVIVPASELPGQGGRELFSLALTKNRGIAAALRDQNDIVIVTDADIAFGDESWKRMQAVQPGEAVTPYYRMALTYQTRSDNDHIDVGMTGTIAMRAEDWEGVEFNERCIAYGAEDGQVLKAIRHKNIKIIRETHIWHIAHDPTADQTNQPGHGRADCWNRDRFNPDNYLQNRAADR